MQGVGDCPGIMGDDNFAGEISGSEPAGQLESHAESKVVA